MQQHSKKEILENIQELADTFYQNHVQAGVERLPALVMSLTDVASNLHPEEQQEYQRLLQALMEAMEAKNYVMLADILTFDIMEAIRLYQI